MVPAKQQPEPSGASPLKVPPANLEAEQAILGGVLLNNEVMNQLSDILRPEDFYKEGHGRLFEGMLDLYTAGDPLDIITLSEHLNRKQELGKAGGLEYIAALVEGVSTSAGVVSHAEIVKALSIRRKLISRCSSISESCFQTWQTTENLLESAEQAIYEIAEEQIRGGFESLSQVITGSFKRLEQVSSLDGYITGVPTGFDDFDRLTAGLQPSDLIIIAGRPSMGKTALALNIGYNAAQLTGNAAAVFSLEMSRTQLGIRLLGFDSGINATRLRTGDLRGKEWEQLTESANRLSEIPIYIDDSSAVTVLEMKAKCRRLKKQRDLCMVIVDYLQLIQGRQTESRQLEISDISRSLKALAKDLNVPVIALSQLNRKVEDRPVKRPQMADLRESGAIEQDADVIAFIYREEVYQATEENRNIAEINVAKQRNGPTGVFKLTFQKDLTRFRNFARDDSVPGMPG